MSLHDSHTSAGIRPHRIRRLKITQPRQEREHRLERRRHGDERRSSTTAAVWSAQGQLSDGAPTDSVAPMPCAKRFGGPGTNRCSTCESRRDHPGDELAEWAQRRSGEHPGDEAVGQRNQQPPLPEHDESDGLEQRHRLRRVGRTSRSPGWESGTAIARRSSVDGQIPTKQLGNCQLARAGPRGEAAATTVGSYGASTHRAP